MGNSAVKCCCLEVAETVVTYKRPMQNQASQYSNLGGEDDFQTPVLTKEILVMDSCCGGSSNFFLSEDVVLSKFPMLQKRAHTHAHMGSTN